MDTELLKKRLLVTGVLGIMIGGIMLNSDDPKKDAPEVAQLSEARDKDAWLRNQISEQGLNITSTGIQLIRQKFKFPEEVVVYNMDSFTDNVIIQDGTTGQVMAQGYCTAKNAFGVTSRYMYEVTYLVSYNNFTITSVNVYAN